MSLSAMGVMMDEVERSRQSKWSLVAMAEFKDPYQCEYLIHTFTSSTKSGLVGSRPGVAHRLEPPEEKNDENLRTNVDEAYAAIVLTFILSPFLWMDTRMPKPQ
ncbi:unnamed protein product [Dibothriocephalus latus]|uniref:Uncharacterized protein n=1 Tax=Dibothriocephalus latus TaxID=60516 RepID=A0A3P7NUY9_DIBLA|nr:unnamed protein product [Dibothriocephalus latus]